ncbi:hypothetical protein AB0K12_02505 [Nonomuraea sp. NPDC049419]|uniref:hypothetical protein n=1 Tax=Nonomuraea sp. NPDC049419 TaxID=3155772 RepID=UPI0034320E21
MTGKSETGKQGTWGCLIVAGLVMAGCSALFGGDDEPRRAAVLGPTPVTAYTSSPAPSEPTWAAESTPTPKPRPDLDRDGIADRYDDDKDGDGVTKGRDLDDRDSDRGRRPPERTPKPQPVREPAPLTRAHPGGFCGSSGAVGVASNGRTYTCLGGHWRR